VSIPPTNSIQAVDGATFNEMFRAGTQWLEKHVAAVDALNVFPVPDGDTGTNMLLTLQSALEEGGRSPTQGAGAVLQALAHGALLGARGNSGVILSQIMRGLAQGLAWTEVGGQLLGSEATLMEGKGKLTLTGKLGDVMQESAQAAMSYVRSRAASFGLPADFYRRIDVHVHVPEGAIPKDGPSAGITLAIAIISALTKIPVRSDVAMTGEITLRGKVLPIGGIKEKLLAAHRTGIRTVILPRDNEKDLADIPAYVQETITLKLVETMDEVLGIALERPPLAIQPVQLGEAADKVRPQYDLGSEADQDQITN